MTPAERNAALRVLTLCRRAGIVAPSHVRMALALHERGEVWAGDLCRGVGCSHAVISALLHGQRAREDRWLVDRRDGGDWRRVWLSLSDRARGILDGKGGAA